MTDYINLKLTYKNVDIYYPLKQKVDLITKLSKSTFKGKLLDIGCGRMPYKNIILSNSTVESYTGMDIENPIYQDSMKPDIFWDGTTIPTENNQFDTVILIEVLEHVPDPLLVLKEIYRVLNTGKVLITVPFLWSLHDVPYDEYRYTPFALKRLCEQAGFKVDQMECFGGWHASLASFLALYLRRAPFNQILKTFLSRLLLPLIKFLYRKDSKFSRTEFIEGQMITGLWTLLSK